MPIRALTIYQCVVILQCDLVQYNSIHLLQLIDILRRAIYCSVLPVFYELELDYWNVNVKKLLFFCVCENLRQLTFL